MRTVGRFEIRETLDELVDPAICALAVIDLQNDFCHTDGCYARAGKDLSAVLRTLPAATGLVRDAQKLGIRCVFVRQQTLPNGYSDSAAWLRFKTRDGKSPEYALAGSWGAQLVDGLRPSRRDIVVDKFRPDAFHGTPLDGLLRANGIESLVVLGVLTEGCVESTVRSASYHDYYTIVVEDCVASTNPINHEGSMALFRARYPLVSRTALLRAWRTARGGTSEDDR